MHDSCGLLCVSIAAATIDAAADLIAANEAVADCFEIRLDAFDPPPAVTSFFSLTRRPLLFTNRPDWEGGGWRLDEEARVGALAAAVQAGAAFVDIELRAAADQRQRLVDACRRSGRTRLVVSWHDFSCTPTAEELTTILDRMRASGADIGKIVTTAHHRDDVLRVLDLYHQAGDFPLSAFCMGAIGAISRLAVLPLGGALTYAAPTGGATTAPGQLDAIRMRAMLEDIIND